VSSQFEKLQGDEMVVQHLPSLAHCKRSPPEELPLNPGKVRALRRLAGVRRPYGTRGKYTGPSAATRLASMDGRGTAKIARKTERYLLTKVR